MDISKNIKQIILHRENYDGIVIDSEDILYITMHGIYDSAYAHTSSITNNLSFSTMKFVSDLYIKLKSSANTKHVQYDSIELDSLVFDLIECQDIVSVELIFDDYNVVNYYVYWENDENDKNDWQHVIVQEDGSCCIGIGETIDEKSMTIW